MPEQTPESNGKLEHPSVRYEKRDASLPAIVTIMGCALALGGLIFAVVWCLFVGYGRQLEVARKSQFPLAPPPSIALPREPRLEQLDRLKGNKIVDVNARQRAKEATLKKYGNTAEDGYVHVPIETAMKHIADTLPVRKEQPKGPRHDLGLVDSGESNSGRLFKKEP